MSALAALRRAWNDPTYGVEDPEQVVIESDPPRRLPYRWHASTPELGEALAIDEQTRAAAAVESRSTVMFEPMGETVKLTVVHGDFEPGSVVLDNVRYGVPAMLSNLTTLETGATLPGLTRQ